MILVDANILLRLGNQDDPEFRRTQQIVFGYRKTDTLVIVPQSLFEFWAVATRSQDVNGLGMDIASARQWMSAFRRMFLMLAEPSEIVDVWTALVHKYAVTGFRAHDARYVAMMELHGIHHLLSYNVKHFQQFPITVLDPRISGFTS